MSSKAFFSARNRFIPAFGLLAAQALACSGGNQFTASSAPDGSSASEDAGGTTIVANPNADTNDASAPPSGNVDATAGLPVVDASVTDAAGAEANVTDAGVTDASGPDALVCPSMGLACDGGCITSDVHNCGACGKTCAVPTNGTATCAASAATYACGIACNTSYTKCGASCADLQSDARNCGSCGHDCIGGACAAGKCQPWAIASTTQNVLVVGGPAGAAGKMITDGKNIVWIDTQAGVLEVPTTGGTQITLASAVMPAGSSYQNIAMAGGVVAWTMTDTTNGVTVWTAVEGTAGSGATAISLGATTAGEYPRGLALDSTGKFAYFVEDPATTGADAMVYKCDLFGSSNSNKGCSKQQSTPASKNATTPNDIMVLGSTLFWTDSANGNILRADYSQNPVVSTIATGQDAPYLLAADSTYLYWAGSIVSSGATDHYSIHRISRTSPTTVEQVLPSTTTDLLGMAVDGVNLYWTAINGSFALDYVPVTGAIQPQSLYSTAPIAVAVSGGVVYWLGSLGTSDLKIYGMRFP